MANKLEPQQLRTVHIIPLTAFDARGELHLSPMRTLTERLFEAGIRVFLPSAGSAEFHSLSAEEIVATIEMTRDVVGDGAVILAPIGRQLNNALRLGRDALAAGADGMLVMPFDFPYMSDVGAEDYCRAVLDGLDCPTMFYKKAAVPTNDLLLKLADHENLIGIKYAENDIDAVNRCIHDDGGRIEWICGSAERFAPFYMLAGASGYTSAAGNLCPRLTLTMHAAITAGDWPEAIRIQQIIRPIEDYRARANNSYNISFLKYALSLVGLDFGQPRPPQRQLTDAERREIDDIMPPILEAEKQLVDAAMASSR